jgi:stage V sporulation protein B
MMLSIFTVVSFSLSTISNAILQGIDKLNVPIKNSGIALVIHLIFMPFLLIVFRLGIYAIVIGDFTFAMTVALLNSFSIKKYLGYKQEIKYTLVKPFICSLIMGLACFVVYHLGMKVIGMNSIWTIIAILVGIVVYGVVLVCSKTITEDELHSMPKGYKIAGLLKRMHLL